VDAGVSWSPSTARPTPTYRGVAKTPLLVTVNGTDSLHRDLRFIITALPASGFLCLPAPSVEVRCHRVVPLQFMNLCSCCSTFCADR
jgi:hypothetical protein